MIRYGASEEVLRHHIGLHARTCLASNDGGCVVRTCPHRDGWALIACDCGQVLFLAMHPDATCACGEEIRAGRWGAGDDA
jgi:hypothetical protein